MTEPPCLLCSSTRGRFWTKKAGRNVHRCPDCRCVWVPDGLVRNDKGESIYEEEEPIFLKDGNEQYYLDETNLLSCRVKVRWVEETLPRGGRLLDVGANFGHFLKAASERFDAVGIEISKAAVDRSAELFGVNNYVGSIYAPPPEAKGPWDAVTLWDVIEHVPDPQGALEAIRDLLAPGGRLYLSTPDAGSAVARAMGSRWHYLDPVQHIVLFGRENLSELLERTGFRVRQTRSFGHYYRVGYVLDRLAYLHGEGALGGIVRSTLARAHILGSRSIYISLRDVMGIEAERI
ncbi:MAG TPA: class I SAM-dependent methyltransferase [Labilithrix sp.]|nr:class I SAM-dependent methyltransferase [Labilithrix sp.]